MTVREWLWKNGTVLAAFVVVTAVVGVGVNNASGSEEVSTATTAPPSAFDWVPVENTQTPAGNESTSGPSASTGPVTLDGATTLALQHAGVDSTSAVVTRVEYVAQSGDGMYTIEFVNSGSKYQYQVRASDGTVVESSQSLVLGADGSQVLDGVSVDVNAAKNAAVAASGQSMADVSFSKAELDYSNGLAYTIEFATPTMTYTYQIHSGDCSVLGATAVHHQSSAANGGSTTTHDGTEVEHGGAEIETHTSVETHGSDDTSGAHHTSDGGAAQAAPPPAAATHHSETSSSGGSTSTHRPSTTTKGGSSGSSGGNHDSKGEHGGGHD